MCLARGVNRLGEIPSADDDDSSDPRWRESDFCSRDGAQRLKVKIEAYWAERGHDVQVVLLNVGFHPAIRASRFDVRSDMINGRPRAISRAASAAPVLLHLEDIDNSDDDLVFE